MTRQSQTVPEATPAAPDLICWLWAAFPPREGTLHVSRIAAGLGVSDTTIRRWIKQAADTELNTTGMNLLRRRAILRGRGAYLWPAADPTTLQRSTQALSMARTQRSNLLRLGPTERDLANQVTSAHQVYLLHFPKAHVFAVSSVRNPKAVAKLLQHATSLQQVTVPDQHAGVILKQTALQLIGPQARCIAPRSLVPTGRTETWLEHAGDLDLVKLQREFAGAANSRD